MGTKCLWSRTDLSEHKGRQHPWSRWDEAGPGRQSSEYLQGILTTALGQHFDINQKMFDNHILTLITCELYLGCFKKNYILIQVDFMRLEILFHVINEETEAWKD